MNFKPFFDKYPQLRVDLIPAVLFGLASAGWIWILRKKPEMLKRMDRTVLERLFIVRLTNPF